MASNVPNAPSDSSRGYESLGNVSAPRENDDPQGMTQDTQGPVARLTSSALDNLEDMPLNDKIAKFYSVQPGGLGGMMTLLHPQHRVSSLPVVSLMACCHPMTMAQHPRLFGDVLSVVIAPMAAEDATLVASETSLIR